MGNQEKSGVFFDGMDAMDAMNAESFIRHYSFFSGNEPTNVPSRYPFTPLYPRPISHHRRPPPPLPPPPHLEQDVHRSPLRIVPPPTTNRRRHVYDGRIGSGMPTDGHVVGSGSLRAIEGIEMWGVWVGMVEYEGVGTGG